MLLRQQIDIVEYRNKNKEKTNKNIHKLTVYTRTLFLGIIYKMFCYKF